MMGFEHPLVLWLAVPWVVGWWWFARLQRRALDWLRANVSERFRPTLTAYTPRSLRWHLLLLLVMGLALVAAGARPTLAGRGAAVPEGGRVLLVLDASASMYATDVEAGEESKNRFEQAREIASGLVRELDGYRFALVTYSGVATVHLPMTGDRDLVAEALRTVEVHTMYQNSGSSLTTALDTVHHFVDDRYQDLQVVLASDGELPFEEDYGDPLAVLSEQEIPVHSVAIGSLEGQGRVIYDFRDVVAKKEERRVLREYTTQRVDEHLQRISRRTGGFFTVAGAAAAETVGRLAGEIASRPARAGRIEQEEARTDLTVWPLLVFVAFFLLDALVIGQRRRHPDFGFDVERLGEGPGERRRGVKGTAVAALLAVVLAAVGCAVDSALWRAHRENERGIARDLLGTHGAARPHYERSIGYRVKPEIPTYNLGRSATLAGDFSEAHRLFQEALQLEPDLVEPYFNDGVALYRWGLAERDPRGCELERTLDLWRQALRRFETAFEYAEWDSELREGARVNQEFVARQIAEIEELVADPPPECTPPPSPPPPPPAGPPPPGTGPEPPPPPGSPPPPPPGGGDQPPQPLTGPELEQIRQELERIAQQAREEGKYHRRTRPEQFAKEDWANPEAEIWW